MDDVEHWKQRALKAEESNKKLLGSIERLSIEKASAVAEIEEMANAIMDLATGWIRQVERFN